MSNLISRLRNRQFKPKKGSDLWNIYPRRRKGPWYIVEVDESGEAAMSSLSPKERDKDEDLEDEEGMAWVREEDLILIK